MAVFPDPSTPFGERVHRRLAESKVIWLTTVGADGTPQPNPVWFVIEDGTVAVYNQTNAKRLAHVVRNPRVSLHLDGNGQGGDILVLTGRAVLVADPPPVDEAPAYVAKYGADAARVSGDIKAFAATYSKLLRIRIDRVRGF